MCGDDGACQTSLGADHSRSQMYNIKLYAKNLMIVRNEIEPVINVILQDVSVVFQVHHHQRWLQEVCSSVESQEYTQSFCSLCLQGDLQSTSSVQAIARQVCEQLIQSE